MSAIVCGDPVALSFTSTVAVYAAAAAGLNSSVMVQLAATARLAAQLLLSTKSVGLVPASEIVTPVNAAVPLLVSVTVLAALVVVSACVAKASLVALKVTFGAVAMPVPVSAMVCGDPVALSFTSTVAVYAAAAAGLNSSVMVQLAATARLAAQLLLSIKSVGLVPASETVTPVSAAVPLLVSVTVLAALVVASVWLPNASLVALNVAAGAAAIPVPDKAMLCGDPEALSLIETVAV